MKVDKNKLKKCSTDVPSDCRNLIEKLKSCSEDELLVILQATTTWTVGKCELYHWVDVLDRFDSILADASFTSKSDWLLAVNHDEGLQNLTLAVLHFTSLLIEYSFSRHLYSSVEHLIKLLSSSNLDIILSVLNLLYVFSKRSNFLSRLTVAQRVPLLERLGYLAESWGGKENGFGLAECCLDSPLSSFPSHATTLHYECYSDLTDWEKNANIKKQANNMFCIHIDKVHEHFGYCDEIMESLSRMFTATSSDSKMSLFTHLRLAYNFAQHNLRLKCVQARLHAISVLVYTNNVTENISGILYSGFTEELVDLLQVKDNTLVDIKAAALRTLTSIVHLDCRDRTPRLGAIVDVTGVSQYHGFLPVLVRRCIDSMTSKKKTKEENPEFPHSFATALFSFLYHLSSYESGGEALVQSGMMGPLLSVVTSMGDQQEQTTFVTRAVRVIDLITNLDWQAFQAVSGLQVFIDRLEHEVSICRHDAPPACGVSSSTSNEDVVMEEDKDVEMDVEEGGSPVQYKPGAQCLPQRAALFKSVLNFLKKAISEQAYGEQVRHMMDGTLPRSLKHIIGNVEYYGPALFLIAMEVATVYVFQEPSLLSSLQDNRLTDVMLHALLVKNPPATREVLASLPNIFSALCLNSRGLTAFVNCNPFDRLCHVMLSPEYLLAMKRRRTSDPLGDTASNLGNAMDELMRHQPSLRTATMEAILKMLKELHRIGSDPSTVCSRLSASKADLGSNSNSDRTPGSGDGATNDENTNQEHDTTFIIRDNEDDNDGSEDEVGEEVPTTKPSTSTQTVSGSKKNVPLLDYIQNVTKFIQAIVSNNMTADHCFEFNVGGGVSELLKLLRLPSLPLDFPSSPACQAVAGLAQTVYSLLGDTNIVQDSFTHVEFLLKKLEPIFLKDDQSDGEERNLSVLLHELLLQRINSKDEVKYVKELVQVNSFVMMLLNLPRASQNEVRVMILKEWGTELGLRVISGLNKLYRSLIWESTVLLALCTPGSENDDYLVLFNEPTEASSQQVAMEINSAEASSKAKDQNNTSAAMAARAKCIKPILTVASKLGRTLAELFGLLGKLAVGRPIRQRFNRHIPVAQYLTVSRQSRALARSLNLLLADGLSWRPPQNLPFSDLRITFLICTVGFTIPMLFDEKKMPYHLMLQYFLSTGAHDALFDCFKWVVSLQKGESAPTEKKSHEDELPGSIDDFLEALFTLIERLVNPRNILNSPHVINYKKGDDVINAPFSPIKFLIKTQKAALNALTLLLQSDRLNNLSVRIFDILILILCHVIRGEEIARTKLQEEIEEEKKKKQKESSSTPTFSEYYFDNTQTTSTTTIPPQNATSQSTAALTTNLATSLATSLSPSVATTSTTEQSSSSREPDPTIVQNLMDMGFPRASVFEALGHFPTLEGATEWLLTLSSEEDRLIRAITMSLDDAGGAETGNAEVEVTESENLEELGWASDSTLDIASNVENNETETKEEPKVPELSQEEIDKKLKEERKKKQDEEEMKILNQGDVEPIPVRVIDKFTEDIFTKCQEWVENLPDTVYRVCDVTLVLMKRDGQEWADKVFTKLLDQIKTSCQDLNSKYKANDSDVWVNDDEIAEGLCTKAILVALLFEEMKESCCKFISKTDVLNVFVNLLIRASMWLKNNKEKVKDVPTPNWISPILLLIDLYERTCVSILRWKKMKSQFSGYKREWKWFDDRSGRWCNYSVSNHKSIDDAYNQGLATVRFAAGRRKYSINFHQLIQCNEESGNRRPIMATYTDNLTTNKSQQEKMETESPAPTDQSKSNATKTDQLASTSSQVSQSEGEKNAPEFTDFVRVDESQANILVHACTEFVCFPVDADTLHSSMRLLLRFTRSGTPGGHDRALLYASLKGHGGLLKLKKKHGFTGLTSLATLLLRHILEDEETLRTTMEKTICNVAGTGAANASCGVSGNSLGNRELHYMLRALAPAACQHPEMFAEMCSKNLRVILPPEVGSRDIDAEETALVEPNAVQFIKPVSPPPPLPTANKPSPIVQKMMQQLLSALIEVYPVDPEKNSDDVATTAKDIPSPANENQTVTENGEKKETSTDSNPEDPLVTKSSILRLIAELVRSYSSCAYVFANHRYTPDMSPLIQQECSCLSFILDNPLIPRSKDDKATKNQKEDLWDEDCPALSRVLLSCLAVSQTHPSGPPNTDPHTILVSELKLALNRAMNGPESPEKHNKLKCLLEIISTIIDCTSKNPNQRNRRLIGRYVKQDHTPDYQSGHVPRLMIRKGLATDLAKLPNFIDLGLSGVAETINTALRPLEILTRPTSFPLIPKNQHGAKKSESPTTTQENLQNAESVSNNQEEFVLDMLVAMVNRNQSGEEQDNEDNNDENDGEGRDSPASDLQYLDASEDQPSNEEEEEEVFMETMEDTSQGVNDDVPDEEEEQEDVDEADLIDLIADSSTIDGSHSIDLNNLTADMSSEDADDDDDDDDDDEEDHEDEGSEMNNEDMEDGDDPEQSYEDLNYDTFVYDLIQGDQSDNDLFIRLENIFGGGVPSNRLPQQLLSNEFNEARRTPLPASPGHQDNRNQTFQASRSIPPPPGTVATCHPLLVRHANHQQVTDSNSATPTRTYSQAASGPPDGWSHRVMRNNGFGGTNAAQRQGANTQESANHTIHLHYTGNAQPRSAPMVLQRLLGPAVAQDILQISNSLYNEGGGRAQVVVNTDEIAHNSDDIIDGMFLDNMFQYGVISPQSSSNVPDNVPSSLARWVEESCVLDGTSLYNCLSLIKSDIVARILKKRDSEIEERRKKRKAEKKMKEEEEERKKKEKKEKEAETSEPLPAVSTPDEKTESSSPNISTPSNTPVATRPDSPSHNNQRVEAISNLQQARSSLLAVSGQLEGLSVTLEQTNQSQNTLAESRAPDAVVEQSVDQNTVEDITAVQEDETPAAVEEEYNDEEERESTPTNMDTTPPQPNPDVDVTNMETDNNPPEVEMQDSNVEADAQIDPTTSNNENPQIMEGVDPSFLAALPADIRQEVIREQLSRSQHLRPPVTTSSANQSRSGVSPEFLAALPPNIQEEVLEQERRERSRNTQPASAEENDPNTFIQTLPTELRQSVLSDMDESLIAVLSEELAAEAQSLRGDAEERQRRYIQERILSHGVNLLRTGGAPTRVRTHDHENSGWGGFFRRRPGFNNRNPSDQQPATNPVPRQILDHESLSCLLILLFVEEARMNTTSLHRVLRNLCYHPPTREWLIATLMSVIQRAGDITSQKSMEVVEVNKKNSSWMSIRLEPALGTRSTIFQLYGTSNVQTARKTQKVTEQKKQIFIHNQAAPLVCRHAIDALIMLAKVFPNYFVSLESAKLRQEDGQVETDFWDILLKLDICGFQKKKLSSKQSHSNDDDSSKPTSDLGMTWLGCLMRTLGHPVVKRSQQLTDRMLRLLAQISRSISTSQSQIKQSEPDKVSEQTSTTTTESTESRSVNDAQNQASSEPDETSAEPTNTATMSARAGTSNTSTVTAHHAAPLTSTTSSSGYHGSISTTTEVLKRTRKMELELSLAVGVLTSHACSEEGLEDATSLLLQLSKSSSSLRLLIINLLLDGAQKLGTQLGDQIQVLLGEIMAYNLKQNESGATQAPSTSRGVIANRFDSTLSVVLSAKEKFKRLGHELQLPSMQVLTSKTSHQAFFLRILKVIIQLQNSSKNSSLILDRGSNPLSNWRNRGLIGRVRDTVSQLEREASALRDLIQPRLGGQRSQGNTATSGESASTASSGQSEPEKEETRLSERLQLEELWEVLGECLKELSKSHDQHAVLVLQPAVESFFLVHATETSRAQSSHQSEQESRESLLSHINEQPPVSPGQPIDGGGTLSSQSSLIDASMPLDMQKFLRFAETHRTVLNQILRQSTIPLSEGPFSVLVDHTRVLDFDVKRRYFRQELERTEESASRRDDVAIRVRRDHLFEDSFRELHRRPPSELRSRLYVVFEGEDGQDAGGVLREWYLVISREIFNPMYALFRTSPGDHGTYTINPLSYINSNHLSYFKFVGRIVAKAIYDNKLLECYFTRSFYKHILGKAVKYTDMEADDYEFSRSLKYMLEHDISSLGTELYFSAEIEEFGKNEVRDLKENGRNLLVSERNKREYVHLVCQEKMTGAIKKQLGAFLEGFYEIIPKRLISIFDEQELELLISGLPTVDIDDLRQNTEYHKYQQSSLQIQWFWRALRSFDQAERAKFLQFVTGTSKVPLLGFSALEGMTGVQKFQIHRDDRSTARLPCAHTCFNQLDLPAYETYDKLRARLFLAISECTEGFGLA